MTNYQDKLLDELELLADTLAHSDKEELAKGEIESLKTAIRHIRQVLELS